MTTTDTITQRLGWIGAGRMGFAMAARVAGAGSDVLVYNRTRSKAEPLQRFGARIAGNLAELGGCDIVFVMVSTSEDLKEVLVGSNGLLSVSSSKPKTVVDCSSISLEASADVRRVLGEAGVDFLAAPVSGNAKVIEAGRLSIVASGPRSAFDAALPYLRCIGPGVTYVGEGELARTAKICHNVLLGVLTQALSEVTVLAQKAGLPRHAFLDFINSSVVGSVFTRYKTPAFVNLDFRVTFTPQLMRKDMDLGLDAGRRFEVPMPLASATRDIIQSQIGNGLTTQDFSTLLLHQARASGIELQPENVAVSDGLA